MIRGSGHGRVLRSFSGLVLSTDLIGCVYFGSRTPEELPIAERPYVAILPFGIDVKIKKLSSIRSVEAPLSAEDEAQEVTETIQAIREEARWLFQSRLATGLGFRFVPARDIDVAVAELDLKPGVVPTEEQAGGLRMRLGADLVVVGTILDYGKVRWQWLAAATLGDMTAESLVIGLASSWNPALLLGNLGWEVLTNVPLYFGGGYLFGMAFRPVRVEVRAVETRRGNPVWQATEVAVYARSALKQLTETDRRKKEFQLRVNLATAMEELADSLTNAALTSRQLSGDAAECKGHSGEKACIARSMR